MAASNGVTMLRKHARDIARFMRAIIYLYVGYSFGTGWWVSGNTRPLWFSIIAWFMIAFLLASILIEKMETSDDRR